MIGILKLNYGNVGSLQSFLKHENFPHKFVGNKEDLHGCSKLIIPGVGNMKFLMSTLEKTDLKKAIIEFSANKKNKLLGICLGMQALLTTSLEYRNGFCLNLIPGEVKKIDQRKNVKLPHIGWNKVFEGNKNASPLFNDLVDPFFYFSHNYVCSNLSPEVTVYNFYYHKTYPAFLELENIYGCQFHPEKSGRTGYVFLTNFCNLN